MGGGRETAQTGWNTRQHTPGALATLSPTPRLLRELQQRAVGVRPLPTPQGRPETPRVCTSVGLKHRPPLGPLWCPLSRRASFSGRKRSARGHSQALRGTGTLSAPGTKARCRGHTWRSQQGAAPTVLPRLGVQPRPQPPGTPGAESGLFGEENVRVHTQPEAAQTLFPDFG